ncbi:ATP-dependent protease subunit HslV [Staphylococcus aureus M0888]|nr:ATP-dependent protease subunit HslV [Staphylococcus aureus M0888]EVM74144.1 ATP-dependent protease subunit HslV [Staphylococcus aureus M0936]
MSNTTLHATTIYAVRHNGKAAMAGDGQVTLGQQVIMKQTARKVRRLYEGKVLAGFAGSVADAFTLFEKFETKLQQFSGNLERAAVELAQEWRGDKQLRQLEAMLIVMDKDAILVVSGTGEVIAPDDDLIAIGSGGNYALSAGRALKRHASHLSAEEMAYESLKVAADICLPTIILLLKHYNNQSTINNYDQLILVKRRRNEINGYSWNKINSKRNRI